VFDKLARVTTPANLVAPVEAAPPLRHPDAPAPGTELNLHYDGCFTCGHPTNGMRVFVTVGEGLAVTGRFIVDNSHSGSPGIAHGGLLAAAFDELMGGLNTLIRATTVTSGLQVSYLQPVPVGTEVHISATIDACVGSRYFISGEGRLGSSDGPLALRAHAVFAKVDLDHFGRYGASEKLAQFKPHLRDGA
jgi:acyl-coenzyme A thioesterase PaaI-like protein